MDQSETLGEFHATHIFAKRATGVEYVFTCFAIGKVLFQQTNHCLLKSRGADQDAR
jgi:hypothetical protein